MPEYTQQVLSWTARRTHNTRPSEVLDGARVEKGNTYWMKTPQVNADDANIPC